MLAQIARERKRLEQERHCLMKRVGRIDLRLEEIGNTETRVVPVIKILQTNTPAKSGPQDGSIVSSSSRITEVTMSY